MAKSVQANNAAVLNKMKSAGAKAKDAAADTKAKLAQARAEFNARKQAKVAVELPQPEPVAPVEQPLEDAVNARIMSAIGTIMEDLRVPSLARVICGTLFGLVLAAGFGYLFGYALLALMIGAAAITGSMFVVNVIYVLGIIVAFFKGGKLGVQAAAYVTSGRIDEHVSAVKNRVTGWFKSKPVVVSTGAFKAA